MSSLIILSVSLTSLINLKKQFHILPIITMEEQQIGMMVMIKLPIIRTMVIMDGEKEEISRMKIWSMMSGMPH